MVKVFSSNKTICLTSNLLDYQQKQDTMLVKIHSLDELQMMYHELISKNHFHEVYYFHENEKLLLASFLESFKIIPAAGGLVRNKKGQYLFIFRNGKWDLPKGKIEKGEGIMTAAIREVEEECGIKKLSIGKEIESTYHIYHINDKAVLKRTYWFEMLCEDESPLIPQAEEGITDVKWFSENDLNMVLENTFDSIKEVMKEIYKY
jgi:8-oxo-dGTP pyrophosphatase MutT (NUDIX family)